MDKGTRRRTRCVAATTGKMTAGRPGHLGLFQCSRGAPAAVYAVILGLGLVVAACSGASLPLPPPPGQAAVAPVSQPTAVAPALSAEQALIQQAWQASKHADTFVEGENNTCAVCHSPRNWMPTDKSTFPATCTSCKFNISTPKPVPKAEWKSVQCDICHRVAKDGTVSSEVVALNALLAMFGSSPDQAWEPVTSTTELCERCHADVDSWHYKRDLGQSAHVGYTCIKCHNAHSNQASCTATGCHPDALNPAKAVAGHDAAHATVSCAACHDASGLKVGPADGQKDWLTFREGGPGGAPGTVPYLSHNLQRKVDCARCHFAGNPWGLKDGKSY